MLMQPAIYRPQVVGGGAVIAPQALTPEQIAAAEAQAAEALKPENQRKLQILGVQAELARMEALAARTNATLGASDGVPIPGRRAPEGMPLPPEHGLAIARIQVASGDEAPAEPLPPWIGDGPATRLADELSALRSLIGRVFVRKGQS
jgi:hypothetical protein